MFIPGKALFLLTLNSSALHQSKKDFLKGDRSLLSLPKCSLKDILHFLKY